MVFNKGRVQLYQLRPLSDHSESRKLKGLLKTIYWFNFTFVLVILVFKIISEMVINPLL